MFCGTLQLRAALILIGLSVCFPGLASAQDGPWGEVIRASQPAVVTLNLYDNSDRRIGAGTGFFVDSGGYLITNYHVLEPADRAEVVLSDRRTYPVRTVVAEDRQRDLVKVRVELFGDSVSAIPLADRVPEVGEPVLVIGSPLGLEQTVSDGIVSSVRVDSEWGNVIQVTAPVSPGSSGSPVVTRDGNVAAVVTFQARRGQNLNFAIAAEAVLNLVEMPPIPLHAWAGSDRTTVEDRGPARLDAFDDRHPWFGRRVRLIPRDPAADPLIGNFGGISPTHVAILDDLDIPRQLPTDRVERVDLSRGYQDNTLAFGILGAVVLGVTGYAIAASLPECTDPLDDFDRDECNEAKVLLPALGGVLGGSIGGLIGLGIRREVWVEVPISRLLGG